MREVNVDRLRGALTHVLSRGRRPAKADEAAPSAVVGTSATAAALAALGVEVWRLGRRTESASEQGDRFKESHGRLVRCLEDAGVRIDDPLGRKFVEGMTADVIDMPTEINQSEDTLVVANVLRPAVYVAGKCVVAPQIVVEHQKSEEAA